MGGLIPGTYLTQTWQSNPTIYAPGRYKRACRYDAFLPELLTGMDLRLSGTTVGVIAEAEQAVRRLNETGGGALAPLSRLLLRTESIASSKVEGLQVGAGELARAEAKVSAGRSAGPEASAILANIDAMTVAIDKAAKASRVTTREIAMIHGRLMKADRLRHVAGKIRTEQNWIGGNDHNPCGADFVPPPPDRVARLLDDLCDAINDDLLPPLLQAALIHAQFETIHPFGDGNGRTGRALIHVVLKRRGVTPHYVPPVSVILAAAPKRYIAGLTRFRDDDGIEEWVEQFAGAVARSAGLAVGYLADVGRLQQRWITRIAKAVPGLRVDATEWRILNVLPAHPVITGPIALAETGRSSPAVYRALETLESAGVLTPLSEGKRNRSWEAVGMMALIEGLETG
ncbi:MAG: Fic family protein [Gemmatimonadales bacterium]|nr:Fic family protein [Gemmatimonadales bacterium]